MDELTTTLTGGVAYVARRAVKDARGEFADTALNNLLDRAIRMSRTTAMVRLTFNTSTSTSYPVTLAHTTDYTIDSHWGSGASVLTSLQKTAANTYVVTIAPTQTNLLGASESVSIRHVGQPHAWSTDAADDLHAKVVATTANSVTIRTESPRGTPLDVGDNSAGVFNVTLMIT